jgi:hypothetical protein
MIPVLSRARRHPAVLLAALAVRYRLLRLHLLLLSLSSVMLPPGARPNRLDARQWLGQDGRNINRLVDAHERDPQGLVRAGFCFDDEFGTRVNRAYLAHTRWTAWFNTEQRPFIRFNRDRDPPPSPGDRHGCGFKECLHGNILARGCRDAKLAYCTTLMRSRVNGHHAPGRSRVRGRPTSWGNEGKIAWTGATGWAFSSHWRAA